ncbi:unnamed protein product [Ixodes pacificus]
MQLPPRCQLGREWSIGRMYKHGVDRKTRIESRCYIYSKRLPSMHLLLLLTKLGSATFEASRALVAAPVYDALISRWLCRPNASHICFCKGVINGYIQLFFEHILADSTTRDKLAV